MSRRPSYCRSAILSVCAARSETGCSVALMSVASSRRSRTAAAGHLPRGTLRLRQEQVAILEAPQRIQQRVGGLILGLHLLGLAEARLRLGPAARLVQGVGMGRALGHPLKRIAAAVGVGHGLLGVPHRPGHLAQRQLQLAQVAGAGGGLFPVLRLTPISSPARIGSRASVSRPKARRR